MRVHVTDTCLHMLVNWCGDELEAWGSTDCSSIRIAACCVLGFAVIAVIISIRMVDWYEHALDVTCQPV